MRRVNYLPLLCLAPWLTAFGSPMRYELDLLPSVVYEPSAGFWDHLSPITNPQLLNSPNPCGVCHADESKILYTPSGSVSTPSATGIQLNHFLRSALTVRFYGDTANIGAYPQPTSPVTGLQSTYSASGYYLYPGRATLSVPLIPASPLAPISAISGGPQADHSCAVTGVGGVQCWGRNQSGQLGNNSTIDVGLPVPVSGLSSGVTAVAAGASHTCALTSAGGVQCWGNNTVGQLGNNASSNSPVPVAVSGLSSGVAAIVAGANHTCALNSAGGLQCWGYNGAGILGNNSMTNSPVPVPVSGLSGNVVAVALGANHSCALTGAGGVQCWGYDAQGQLGNNLFTNWSLVPVAVTGLSTGVFAIAAGADHTCALMTGGSVQCWGQNANGQLGNNSIIEQPVPVPVSGLSSGVTAIAAGGSHTCALTGTGGVQCWGANESGELGNNSTIDSSVPVPVSGLSSGVVAIAAGSNYTCAIASSGTMQCWGNNTIGQLGNQSPGGQSLVPIPVLSGATQSSVFSSAFHPSAGLFVSVDNTHHSIGIGSGWPSITPTYPGGILAYANVSPCCPLDAYDLSSALSSVTGHEIANAVFPGSWPATVNPSLPLIGGGSLEIDPTAPAAGPDPSTSALGLTGAFSATPLTVASSLTLSGGATGLKSSSSIEFGGTLTLAAGGRPFAPATDDVVFGFGPYTAVIPAGSFAQSGSPFYYSAAVNGSPVQVTLTNTGGSTYGYSIAVRNADLTRIPSLASFDFYLGDNAGSAMSGAGPSITAGGSHTCAVTSSGGAQCWGYNFFGQLGNNSLASSYVPVVVSGLSSGVAAITAGQYHTCALLISGGVQCWGQGGSGQLGNNSTANSLVPAAVSGLSSGVVALAGGYHHTCALTGVGGVLCWGDNSYGQLGNNSAAINSLVPVSVSGLSSGVIAIAAGQSQTCALTSTGGVLCWGDNQFGQLGNNSMTRSPVPVAVSGLSSGVIAIASGRGHTCAVTSPGGVQCWGSNVNGQLGNNSTTQSLVAVPVSGLSSGVVAITAGAAYTCALTSGGAVQCWGYNADGELGNNASQQSLVPVAVSGLGSDVVGIAASVDHTCALTTGGGLQCWGLNTNGQLGNNSTVVDSLVPTAVSALSLGTIGQAITLGPIAYRNLGTVAVLSATASSGLPVSFTSNRPAVCTVSASAVSLLSLGTCTITASQAGDGIYAAAAAVTVNIPVALGSAWDAVAGFSAASNPGAVWSYLTNGSALTVGSTCNTFTCWTTGLGAPYATNIGANATASDYPVNGGPGSTVYYYANSLFIDPQASTATVRFTAPISGRYAIKGAFVGEDTITNAHGVQIISNGATVFSNTVSSFGQSAAFSLTQTLAAGSAVDFNVLTGSGGCSYCYLGTGLRATVVLLRPAQFWVN